jgi:sulfur dioxygenase
MTATNILNGTVGGLLIGIASSVLLFGSGKVMGISGKLSAKLHVLRATSTTTTSNPPFSFIAGILNPLTTSPVATFKLPEPTKVSEALWRYTFVSGIFLTTIMATLIFPDMAGEFSAASPPAYLAVIGGLLVGAGTTLGNGCTSGHGVCGLGRLSVRSFAAVGTFFPVAIITATIAEPLFPSGDDVKTTAVTTLVGPAVAILFVGMSVALYLLNANQVEKDVSVAKSLLPAAVSSVLFTCGLLISGMANPAVVRDFLNVRNFDTAWNTTWNGTLAFVMGGAVLVSLVGYQYKKRKPTDHKPLLCATDEPCECSFNSVPNGGKPDSRLIAGATLFGIGWGLTGICPGPALVGGALGAPSTVGLFLPAFFVAKALSAYLTKQKPIPVGAEGDGEDVNVVDLELADSSNVIFRQLFDKESSTYTYLLGDPESREAIIIDPVDAHADRDIKVVADLGLDLVYGLNTHAHADHITGTSLLRDKLVSKRFQSVISEASNAKADVRVKDGDKIYFGKRYIEVLLTPGHTAGCASFVTDDSSKVFTGDTLLIGGCGRTDFQEGSATTLFSSVRERLFTLPDTTTVFPAHDYKGLTCSSIGEEKANNPRLNMKITEAEFVQIMADLKLAHPKMLDVALPKNMSCGV